MLREQRQARKRKDRFGETKDGQDFPIVSRDQSPEREKPAKEASRDNSRRIQSKEHARQVRLESKEKNRLERDRIKEQKLEKKSEKGEESDKNGPQRFEFSKGPVIRLSTQFSEKIRRGMSSRIAPSDEEEGATRKPIPTGHQIVTKSILKTAQSYIKDPKPKDKNMKDESIKWDQDPSRKTSMQDSRLLPAIPNLQTEKPIIDPKPPQSSFKRQSKVPKVDPNLTLPTPLRNREKSLQSNPKMNKTLEDKIPRAESKGRDPKAGRNAQVQNPQKPITTFQMGRKTRDTKRRGRFAVIPESDKESLGNLLIDTEFDKDVMSPVKKEAVGGKVIDQTQSPKKGYEGFDSKPAQYYSNVPIEVELAEGGQQDIKGLTNYGTFYKVEAGSTVSDLHNTNNTDKPEIKFGRDQNNEESPNLTIITTKNKKTKKIKLKMLTVSSVEDNQTFINQDAGLETQTLETPGRQIPNLDSNFVKIDTNPQAIPPYGDGMPPEPKKKKKKKDNSLSRKKVPKKSDQPNQDPTLNNEILSAFEETSSTIKKKKKKKKKKVKKTEDGVIVGGPEAQIKRENLVTINEEDEEREKGEGGSRQDAGLTSIGENVGAGGLVVGKDR